MVVGEKDKFCTEETPLNPISLYGQTKTKAENYIADNHLNSVRFRLATVFGCSPRMRLDLLVNDFVLKAVKDGYVVLFEANFKRNYIHIKDVCAAIMFSIENFQKVKNETFNLGLSSANLSKLELCNKIKEYIPNFEISTSEIGTDIDKRDYIVSNDKIEKAGFKASVSLDEGIKELKKFYNYLIPDVSKEKHMKNIILIGTNQFYKKSFEYYIKDKKILPLYYLKDNDFKKQSIITKIKLIKPKFVVVFSGLSGGIFYNIRNSDKILEYNTEAYLKILSTLKICKIKKFFLYHRALIQKTYLY